MPTASDASERSNPICWPARIGRLVVKDSVAVLEGVCGSLMPAPVKVVPPPGVRTRRRNGPPLAPESRQRTMVPFTGEVTFAPGSGKTRFVTVTWPNPPENGNGALSGLPTVTVAAWALGATRTAQADAVAINTRPSRDAVFAGVLLRAGTVSSV